MPKTFSIEEHRILNLFAEGKEFVLDDNKYTVRKAGKPTCAKGEPKTDIYVGAQSNSGEFKELKISFKKHNANFLENKTSSARAEILLGPQWERIIANAINNHKAEFCSRKLIFKNGYAHTNPGSITLGWKFELLNIQSGILSENLHLTHAQVIDIYAGTNLPNEKKNAYVNGVLVQNSGIANYILLENEPLSDIQSAVNSLITIEEYVNDNPNVFFACKALNYRSFEKKYDGDRPLAVYVDWYVSDKKLDYNICFDSPLKHGGDYAFSHLIIALKELGINSTEDINSDNVTDSEIINF